MLHSSLIHLVIDGDDIDPSAALPAFSVSHQTVRSTPSRRLCRRVFIVDRNILIL